jgi:formylglycine-generating enzyme
MRLSRIFFATLCLLAGSAILLAYTYKIANGDDRMVRIEVQLESSDSLQDFLIDKDLVTVGDFKEFVLATGYVTDAERFGNGGVFDPVQHAFVLADGATYQYPFGKEKPAAETNHPVTQVSYNDAVTFATWKGKRLPTRAEWELAAGYKSAASRYSWGDYLYVDGRYKANTWQGSFPFNNTVDDGFEFTSPVGAFGENKAGLTDMGGNVWQWCSDIVEPLPHEKMFDPSMRRVLKGGSYLCDPAVCHGYEIQGETSSTPESSMAHIGFRCVKDVSK